MRKLLLSFLGLGDYQPCYYLYEGKKSTLTRFIQTAIYEHTKEEGPLDIIVFATKEAEAQNWEDHVSRDGELLEGMKNAFKRIAPEANVQLVNISSIQDEEANWSLFDAILAQIKEGDEIYFDMTHGFRSIPIVALIVLNYARLIKKAKIKRLMYGLFDPKHPEKLASIVDVTNMVALLDWTNGVDQFIRTGDASLLKQLTNIEAGNVFRDPSVSKEDKKNTKPLKELANQLDRISQSFQTCRSMKISDEIRTLKKYIRETRESSSKRIKPIVPLLSEIEDKYAMFSEDEIMNGYLSVEWCKDHRLIQPGLTLLRENYLTAICEAFNIDRKDVDKRELISAAIKILLEGIPEEEWRVSKEDKPFVKQMLFNLKPYRKWLKTFESIRDFRNDINHAGTKPEARKVDKFYPNFNKLVQESKHFFEKMSEIKKQQA